LLGRWLDVIQFICIQKGFKKLKLRVHIGVFVCGFNPSRPNKISNFDRFQMESAKKHQKNCCRLALFRPKRTKFELFLVGLAMPAIFYLLTTKGTPRKGNKTSAVTLDITKSQRQNSYKGAYLNIAWVFSDDYPYVYLSHLSPPTVLKLEGWNLAGIIIILYNSTKSTDQFLIFCLGLRYLRPKMEVKNNIIALVESGLSA